MKPALRMDAACFAGDARELKKFIPEDLASKGLKVATLGDWQGTTELPLTLGHGKNS